ncbi:transcriptional regulator ATRX homolog [Drosophila serrata]|uniref:transcriptional regulator ATRX homolog n=1 Tax=Drosophila serrata TaxID=7274 RepID=UPI000A1D387D|nr:transcriptional regulator ATRX homolog [Drosophila serrata]
MKKKQVESASEEEEVLAEDSEVSDDEELSAEGSEASGDEDDSEASGVEENSELDLAASSTESDDDDDEEENSKPTPKSRAEVIDEQIHSKYEQLRGTRLYVRFPKKLPLDVDEFNAKVKALHPLVVKALKPRQKHARFCLVEFKSQKERDQAHEDLKTSIKTDDEYKGFYISLPKTDSAEFINELVTRKQTSVENRRTKRLMKRASKKALQGKRNFTSSVVITNLPKTASVAQVRQLFAEAVDIQIKPGKGKFRDASAATITLPSTHDARKAIKQKLSLAGTELILRFNTQTKRKTKPKAKNGKSTPEKNKNQGEKKIPIMPKQQDKQQKPKVEKGEAPKINKPIQATQQKPKENLKRKTPPNGGESLKLKTPKKLKKLIA